MSTVIVTGSGGVVGSAVSKLAAEQFGKVIGIDNDQRRVFFGEAASTASVQAALCAQLANFESLAADIRDLDCLEATFKREGHSIELVIHAAAQPSHDWSATDPLTDFSVNATGTLNLLECTRRYAPDATFILVSTNKVYGDLPNDLPLEVNGDRFELPRGHPSFVGIDESMPLSPALHSIFGASKLAADVMTQEYGKYFGLKTGVFRGGCLTGPLHAGVPLHGFLSYLAQCSAKCQPYTVIGYEGLQVRDNLHCEDLARMFFEFHRSPRPGEVYNVGGGRNSNCSVREAIAEFEERTGREMVVSFTAEPRIGDHKWYVTDLGKFESHFPGWRMQYNRSRLFDELTEHSERLALKTGRP